MSLSPAGTRHLQFLMGHGAVLRINLVRATIYHIPLVSA